MKDLLLAQIIVAASAQAVQHLPTANTFTLYKEKIYTWTAFDSEIPGNTPEWYMSGTFDVQTKVKGDPTVLLVELNIYPGLKDQSTAGNVY